MWKNRDWKRWNCTPLAKSVNSGKWKINLLMLLEVGKALQFLSLTTFLLHAIKNRILCFKEKKRHFLKHLTFYVSFLCLGKHLVVSDNKNEPFTCTVDKWLVQDFLQNEHYEVPWFCRIALRNSSLVFLYWILYFLALNNFFANLSLKCRKWTRKMPRRNANLMSPGR